MSSAVLVWCGDDASVDQTVAPVDKLPHVVLRNSDIPAGGKTSQSSLTFKVSAKNSIATHYAYQFLDGRVDCSSLSFSTYQPISDPIKITDTGDTGEKTICLSGRGVDDDEKHIFQPYPTQVTFLKVHDIEATTSVKVIARGMPQASCEDSITANIDIDTGSSATSFKWCLIKDRTSDTCLSCSYSESLNLAEHGSIELTRIGNFGEKELCLKGANGENEQFPATSYVWNKTLTGAATISTIISQYDPSNNQTIQVSGGCEVTHYKYYFYEHPTYHVPCPAVETYSGFKAVDSDLQLLDLINNEGSYKTLCIAGANSRREVIQNVPNRLTWITSDPPENMPDDIPATLRMLNGSRTVFSSGDKFKRPIELENVSGDTVDWSMNMIGRNTKEYFEASLDGQSNWVEITNNSQSVKKILSGTLEAGEKQKIHIRLNYSYKTDYTNKDNYVSVFFRDDDNPNKHISQLIHVRSPALKFHHTFTLNSRNEKIINLTSRTRHVRIQIENSAYPCLNYESGILMQKVKCGKLDWIAMPAPGHNDERWFYYTRRVDPTLPRRGLIKHNVFQVGIDQQFKPTRTVSTKIRIVSNELDDSRGGDIYTYNHPAIKFYRQNDDGTYRPVTVEVPWRTGKVHDIRVTFRP